MSDTSKLKRDKAAIEKLKKAIKKWNLPEEEFDRIAFENYFPKES